MLTEATAINVWGEVAGVFRTQRDQSFGFVYSEGTYTDIYIPEATGIVVTGVNANREVAGYYEIGSRLFSFIATPSPVASIPESSTEAMLLAGFAGLGLIGYRKTKSADRVFRLILAAPAPVT
jgi:hypothetical protein